MQPWVNFTSSSTEVEPKAKFLSSLLGLVFCDLVMVQVKQFLRFKTNIRVTARASYQANDVT